MLQPLISQVAESYGIDLAELAPIDGGKDANAQAFRARTPDDREFFIKRKSDLTSAIEISVALYDQGNHAVLAPLRTLSGATSAGNLLIYPYVEGTNGFQRDLELSHWCALGVALRGIHDTSLPGPVQSLLSKETFKVSGVDGFMALCDRQLIGEAGERLTNLIRENRSDIERVVEQTRRYGDNSEAKDSTLVPCHADLHIGNILIDADERVHIIDWDTARLGPRECDLMFMVNGGIMNLHGIEEEQSFFAGYGHYDLDADLIAYYRYARVLEDFVAYAEEATDPQAFLNGSPMEAVEGFATVLKGAKLLNAQIQ